MINEISGNQILIWGVKALIMLLLVVFLFFSFAGYQQARLVNSAVKTKLSGLINLIGILFLVAIVVSIFLVALI